MGAWSLPLAARIAKAADYPLVAHLCRRAVGPEDYVLPRLRRVIRKGSLFLALVDQQVVGMTHLERCIDGSGWLGMARTDPAWRGRGIAGFLIQRIAAHARSRELKALRLWTAATNTRAQRVCQKAGFQAVCEAAHVALNVKRGCAGSRSTALPDLPKYLADSLLRSRYVRKLNGCLPYQRHIVRATKRLLQLVAERRELYGTRNATYIFPRPERWRGASHTGFTLLQGPLSASLRAVEDTARAMGVDVIGTYLPYDGNFVKPACREGFQVDSWGRHCIVFERKLVRRLVGTGTDRTPSSPTVDADLKQAAANWRGLSTAAR